MVIVKDGGDHGDRPRSSALVVVTDGVLPCKEECLGNLCVVHEQRLHRNSSQHVGHTGCQTKSVVLC